MGGISLCSPPPTATRLEGRAYVRRSRRPPFQYKGLRHDGGVLWSRPRGLRGRGSLFCPTVEELLTSAPAWFPARPSRRRPASAPDWVRKRERRLWIQAVRLWIPSPRSSRGAAWRGSARSPSEVAEPRWGRLREERGLEQSHAPFERTLRRPKPAEDLRIIQMRGAPEAPRGFRCMRDPARTAGGWPLYTNRTTTSGIPLKTLPKISCPLSPRRRSP